MLASDNVNNQDNCKTVNKSHGFLIPLSIDTDDMYRVIPDYECEEEYRFLINNEPMPLTVAIKNGYLTLTRLKELEYPIKSSTLEPETIVPAYIVTRTLTNKLEDGSEQIITVLSLYSIDQSELINETYNEFSHKIDGQLYHFSQSGEYRYPLFMIEVSVNGVIKKVYTGLPGLKLAIDEEVITPEFVVDSNLPGINVYIEE